MHLYTAAAGAMREGRAGPAAMVGRGLRLFNAEIKDSGVYSLCIDVQNVGFNAT